MCYNRKKIFIFEIESNILLFNDDFKYIDIIIEKNNNISKGIIKYKYDNFKLRFVRNNIID